MELVRLVGGSDRDQTGVAGGAGFSSTKTKTQLTGLRTAMLQRWEKITVSSYIGVTGLLSDACYWNMFCFVSSCSRDFIRVFLGLVTFGCFTL